MLCIQEFWATCACPEKQSCPEILQCMEYTFYIQNFWAIWMRLPWKTEFPWYFSEYLNMHFYFIQDFWATSACPEKQSCPEIFRCMEYTLYILNFCATCMRMPWKTEGSLNLLHWIYLFYYQEFWVTCAYPEKQSCPGIFPCIEYTLCIQEFWSACACPEKQSCLEIIRCKEYTFYIKNFWATCAWPEKQLPWCFSLYLNMYFLLFRSFEQHALALKNRGYPGICHCMEYTFYIQEFWATCMRIPWKTEFALIFFAVLNMYFLSFMIFEQLALALKNRVVQEFFAVWNILFPFWIFVQLACACPEKHRVSWIYCTECIFFIIQEFWVTCACHENRGYPGIVHCIEYTFYIQNFWATYACPEKQRVPWIHYIECIFLSFRIFDQLALVLKTELPWCFSLYLNMYFLLFRSFEQLALALRNRRCPGIFHCVEYTFSFRNFEQLACACPENQSLPWYFSLYWTCIFYHSWFLSNLRLPWKTELPRNFCCMEYTFYILNFCATCMSLPWKTEGSLNLLHWIYLFYYSGVLSNLRLPWKTELPWNFSLYWSYFLHSEFLSNLRLPWKTEASLNSLYWMHIFYYSGFLSNLRLPWKTEGALKFFAVLNIFFIILEFWVTCACPENRVALEFFTVLKDILLFRIFEQLAVALKTELPWNFWSPGAVHPRPPRLVRLCL